jgi:Zn-dependent peptidase ImmA (M78 family)
MNPLLASVRAAAIIESLQIRNPDEICVRDISMERGALVRERHLEGSEGRLVRKGRIGIITVNKSIPEKGRKRFAIAHELGHFELHRDSQLILCTEEDMYLWNESKEQELEANEFAGSILMPRDIFIRYCEHQSPNINYISEIACEFRTTLTATALRYAQISSESCAVVVCEHGTIRWYKKSGSFNYHVKVGERLSPHSHAFDHFDGVDMPKEPEKVPASAWLAGDLEEEAEIMEHSLALGSYGVVLSLLWLFEEIRPPHRGYERQDDAPEFDLMNHFTPDGKRWRW